MVLWKIPPHDGTDHQLKDGQFISIQGPDQLTTGYKYDLQQRALYFKESQVLYPCFHGATHVAEDPVPNATCDSPGMMAADDKCKLDAMLQMRLGVLGFQGAGFPDDGGWMCLPGDAQVLRPDGSTTNIRDLRGGDRVITHTGADQEIIKTYARRHDGDILNIRVADHDRTLRVTPEHPVLATQQLTRPDSNLQQSPHLQDNVKLGRTRWVEAKNLKVGDYLSRRFGSDVVRDRRSINYVECREQAQIPAGVASGDDSSAIGLQSDTPDEPSQDAAGEVWVDAGLLWLTGYYLASGYIEYSLEEPQEVVFRTHHHRDTTATIREISSCCRTAFGMDAVRGKDERGRVDDAMRLESPKVARFFAHLFEDGASEYALPQWMLELPPEKQKWIVGGFMSGLEGPIKDITDGQVGILVSGRQLATQIAGICERLGLAPIVSTIGARSETQNQAILTLCGSAIGTLNQQIDRPENFNLTEDLQRFDPLVYPKRQTLKQIESIETDRYEGIVYNLAVDGDNSYVADDVIVHNCGDVILAAGSEFISLERIGNVVRFTVDSPIPMLCNCEECNEIYWVQDETEVAAIRPPVCSGKLPGANVYGEMKVYAFPESAIADPNDASGVLNNKGNYPSFIFKRYDDTIVPGAAEHEMVLKRDSNNRTQTEIGWSFTPGATGVPEMVWFMGKDDGGNQIRFDLNSESEPGLLGSLLCKGHLITKQMGVIVDYTSTVLSSNQYSVRFWNVNAAEPVGDAFTAKNVYQYNNPENSRFGSNPKSLILDSTSDLLPIGTLVDIWSFKVGEAAGEPINRYYFSKQPRFNPNHAWIWTDAVQFGDTAIAREEVMPGTGNESTYTAAQVPSIRDIERSMWGVTGFDDPVYSYDVAEESGTEAADLNVQHRAVFEPNIPALKVEASPTAASNFSERPVWVWNRHRSCNWLVRADIGRPTSSDFIPYDLMLRSEIDEHTNKYLRVVETGTFLGLHYVRVCGLHFHDLPPFGSLRVLTSSNKNAIFNYTRKFVPSSVDEADYDSIILTCDPDENLAFPGDAGDIVELLHQEYSGLAVRVEFNFDSQIGRIETQFKVGVLNMGLPWEQNATDSEDDFVRGLSPGYAVSAVYSQAGTYDGVGTAPDSSPPEFVVYDGGMVIGGEYPEYWNRLEVMLRDDQIWIWWNNLLIPPSPSLSAGLPVPVDIETPYFPVEMSTVKRDGKVGLRMWPGSVMRRMDVRTQMTLFNEFSRGQLEIS